MGPCVVLPTGLFMMTFLVCCSALTFTPLCHLHAKLSVKLEYRFTFVSPSCRLSLTFSGFLGNNYALRVKEIWKYYSLQIDALTKSTSRINRGIDYYGSCVGFYGIGTSSKPSLRKKEHSSSFSGFSLLLLIISVKYMRWTEPSTSERAFLVL